MSEGGSTRFQKGQSGNPKGRPRLRRAEVSAFDIVLDKTLSVTQHGVTRELTVDEALQLQTYQSALKGSRMAIRTVLKMIEKREAARARRVPQQPQVGYIRQVEYDTDNAQAALQILDVVEVDVWTWSGHRSENLKLKAWAAQAALDRKRGVSLSDRAINLVRRHIVDADTLRWPGAGR